MTTNPLKASDRPIICPQCQTSTTLANTRCPKCGVNLVLAIARSAREVLSNNDNDITVPYEADKFLHRFGEYLLKQGDISSSQLDAALARQKSGGGQNRTVGQILLEMGAVNRDQLDRASQAQVKETQNLLRETQNRLRAQAGRIKQLEATLGDLAELDRATLEMLSAVLARLRAATGRLRDAEPAPTTGGPLDELEALIVEIGRFTTRDR